MWLFDDFYEAFDELHVAEFFAVDLLDMLSGGRVGHLLEKPGVYTFRLAFLVEQFAELCAEFIKLGLTFNGNANMMTITLTGGY